MPRDRIRDPVILGVCGDSATGKTTLSAGIGAILGPDRVAVICSDDHHAFTREERAANGLSALDPRANCLDILEQDLVHLRNKRPILKPVYNHNGGLLERPVLVEPKPYIIVEALLGFTTHSGTVVGKLEGDREATLGWVDIMRERFVAENRSRGIFFDQDWGHMPGLFPVASGGIHVWHMPALTAMFGDDAVFQFGEAPSGILGGTPAGAAANRVALEACIEARNQGRAVEREGRDILTTAAKHSPELGAATETWKEVTFDFDTVDKLAAES